MNKAESMNFNVSDQYIQQSRGIGKTTYFNLNTNMMTTVPWGSLDWLNVLLGEIMSIGILGGLVYLVGHYFKAW